VALNIFYSKGHTLVHSDPATICFLSCIFLPDYVSTCTLFIPDLAPIAPPFSWLMLYLFWLVYRLYFLYNILWDQFWFPSLTTWPLLTHCETLFQTSEFPCHSRDLDFILDLYFSAPLDYAPDLDYSKLPDDFWHFWESSGPRNTSEILRHEYKVVRHSAQSWSQHLNPLGSRLSSAVHCKNIVTQYNYLWLHLLKIVVSVSFCNCWADSWTQSQGPWALLLFCMPLGKCTSQH